MTDKSTGAGGLPAPGPGVGVVLVLVASGGTFARAYRESGDLGSGLEAVAWTSAIGISIGVALMVVAWLYLGWGRRRYVLRATDKAAVTVSVLVARETIDRLDAISERPIGSPLLVSAFEPHPLTLTVRDEMLEFWGSRIVPHQLWRVPLSGVESVAPGRIRVGGIVFNSIVISISNDRSESASIELPIGGGGPLGVFAASRSRVNAHLSDLERVIGLESNVS